MKEREIIAKEWRDDNGILHRREVGQELVRCKECKNAHLTYDKTCQYCDKIKDDEGFLIEVWLESDHYCSYGEREDEPTPRDDYIETENDHLEARCLNCNNAKACKEKHWEGCVYEPKDEKTCETCKYWKYIAHEWQCETTKCQGYTPKTEQTERSE